MRNSLLLVLGLVAPLAHGTPDIQHWQTANGAEVYFVEAHELPMVDVRVIFDGGSARDGGHAGVAVLTNGLLAEGADGLSADEISDNFEANGAIFEAGALRDMAWVSLRSLTDPDKLEPAVANLSRVLSRPDFPADVLDRERSRLLVALRYKQQSPSDLAQDAFYRAVYGEHPYAHPSEGTVESVQALSRDDVSAFYARYYTARNAVVAIVGDLSSRKAKALAEAALAGLPEGGRAAALPPVPALTGPKEVRVAHPSAQTHILVGQAGVARGDPDVITLYVGNHALGGGGLVSRLSEEIREKRGLSYSVSSYFLPMRRRGPFTAGLQTRSDQADEALAVLQANLAEYVAEGPTAAELRASKQNITGGFPLRIDSNRKIVGYLAMIGFYGLPLDYLDTFNGRVEAVTQADIREALRKHLSPDRMITVRVGGESATAVVDPAP
ncbi:MAG: pitrilysin family protein [Gammaproteobacteria bacterium]